MKKEIDINKYNKLCDQIRSTILYTEAFSVRNKRRVSVIKELIEIVRSDGLELIEKVKDLEKLTNDLCEIKSEDES